MDAAGMTQHEQHEARRTRCLPMMSPQMDSFAQMLLMTPSERW